MNQNKINEIDLFVALKIAEYYPLGIVIMVIIDESTGLHSAAVWSCDSENTPMEVIFHDNDYSSRSEQEAIDKMVKLLKIKMNEVKIMSN